MIYDHLLVNFLSVCKDFIEIPEKWI
jgi:hypothetical protein